MHLALHRRVRLLPSCLLSLSLALACRATPIIGPVGDSSSTIGRNRIDLGTLGGASSLAADINGAGTVVGSAENAAGLRRAFRWTVETGMTDLGTLPGDDWSEACCITDDGRILGVSGSSSVSTSNGTTVVWAADGTISALAIPLLPGATFGMPTGFNERGDVIGWDAAPNQHAWIWSEARGKVDITASVPGGSSEGSTSDIDANGVVVGTNKSRTAPCANMLLCWRPFLWSDESGYRELDAAEDDSTAVAAAIGMNGDSTIVGWARTNALGSRPFVWHEGSGYTILSTPGGGYATAINSAGIAVGAAWYPDLEAYQATAWLRSGQAIRLSPDEDNPQIAVAVNDMGVVAGWSAQSDGTTHASVWLTGSATSALMARAAAGNPPTVATKLPTAASRAATRCLSSPETPVSRGALFWCATGGSSLPHGAPSR